MENQDKAPLPIDSLRKSLVEKLDPAIREELQTPTTYSREMRASNFKKRIESQKGSQAAAALQGLYIFAEELSEYGDDSPSGFGDFGGIQLASGAPKVKGLPRKANTTKTGQLNAQEAVEFAEITMKEQVKAIEETNAREKIASVLPGSFPSLASWNPSSGGSVTSSLIERAERPKVFSVGLDFFNKTVPELIDMTMEILYQLQLTGEPNGSKRDKLYGLVGAILKGYVDTNTYHNHTHAFAVFHTGALIFTAVPDLQKHFGDNNTLAFLIASLGHDYGHPGYSNNCEIKLQSTLARRTQNKAVLESYHASAVVSFLKEQKFDIFEDLSGKEKVAKWKFVTKLIISTDMSMGKKHVQTLKEAKNLHHVFNVNNDLSTDESSKRKRVARFSNALIHACDVSAQLSDLKVATEWCKRVNLEFRHEAQFLVANGVYDIPPHLCDSLKADEKDVYSGQVSFIKYNVEPLWEPLFEIFPELIKMKASLLANKEFYEFASKETEASVKRYLKRKSFETNETVLEQIYEGLRRKANRQVKPKKTKRSKGRRTRRSGRKAGRSMKSLNFRSSALI